MATKRQYDANRRNARKSTGPTSEAGKAISSMNALKTGLYAESEILRCENPVEYEQLIERFYNDHNPATALACHYVDEMIYCTWNLRRLRRAEAQLYDFVHGDCFQPDDDFPLGQPCAKNPKVFGQLQWRMDANRRALDRAVKSLREVQAVGRPAVATQSPAAPAPQVVPATETIETASPEIGFVPNTLPKTLPKTLPNTLPDAPREAPAPVAETERPGMVLGYNPILRRDKIRQDAICDPPSTTSCS